MPYEVKKRGPGYKVTSPNHPQGFSKKPMTLREAKLQLRAIYMHTKGK
jgi:hypothetical protein